MRIGGYVVGLVGALVLASCGGGGTTAQRAPDGWRASDGRWYPPDHQAQRRVETAKEIALVTGVLFVVTLLTYLVLSR